MGTLSNEFLDLQTALAGEYSLERELGRGGMGVVYLARDVQLDRHVAIKVLPSHLAEQPESRERFLREARTAAGLSHPNIVPIHRVGEAAGFVFFVMSYVAGRTLGERLREQGPLGAADATRLLREVAWALAYAHGRGIVHRDVKPDNILIEEGSGRALVTDFGIAHVGSGTLSTDPGKIMGTAHFMSPEQATSETVDGRSDLYSLGVVGFLATSGRLPFEAANVPALLLKQVTEVPPALSNVAPGISAILASAIDRCLQKDPSARFADGEEMAAALAPATDGRPELPLPLRNWLTERNPAQAVYGVWTGLLGIPILSELSDYAKWHHPYSLGNVVMLAAVAAAPLAPMVGFYVTQAKRLFGAGYTVDDLRGALDVAGAERSKGSVRAKDDDMTPAKHALRALTYASMATAFTTSTPYVASVWYSLHVAAFDVAGAYWQYRPQIELAAWLASAVLLAVGNANRVPLLPVSVRKVFRVGVRERLWRSRIGAWIGKRFESLHPSRPVGAGLFRATEVALSAALGDLFAALPSAYRGQLAELPAIVSALESRASAARGEIEMLDALPQGGPTVAGVHAQRRVDAKAQLGASVAALEGVRLDLLRLHAGASDLGPLTTLLDAARLLAEDVQRLAQAQDEIEMRAPNRPLRAGRIPTPA